MTYAVEYTCNGRIDAFCDGKKPSDCPFSAQAQRDLFEAWMAGWLNERDLRAALNTH